MNNQTGNKFKTFLLHKLREPSTWAGLSIFAAALGVPPGTFELVTQIGIAAGGIASVFMNEGGF